MPTKDHSIALVEAGKATRFGPQWPGQRCLAKTRRATLCQKAAITERNRCRLHGGRSTGPRTAEGKARVVAANTKHGRRSRARIERGRAINDELRQIILECQETGFLPYK